MGLISSMFGSVIGLFLPDRPYWAVKLQNGKWLSELDMIRDEWQRELPTLAGTRDRERAAHLGKRGSKRAFDWTLDLVSTGDVRRVRQLWLFCPPNPFYPYGQSDFLETKCGGGDLFQLKVRHLHAWGGASSLLASQLIGRLDDPATGACSCKVWDAQLNVMGNWSSCLFDMGSWRDGVGALGTLDLDVLGIRLPTL